MAEVRHFSVNRRKPRARMAATSQIVRFLLSGPRPTGGLCLRFCAVNVVSAAIVFSQQARNVSQVEIDWRGQLVTSLVCHYRKSLK